MRILHAFKDYFPPTRGGIEHHIHDVCHSLKGFQFAVLTSSRTKKQVIDNDEGVRVIRAAEYARPVSTPYTPSWPKLIRDSGADVLHFHMPNPFGELFYLRSRSKVPMVAGFYSEIVGREFAKPLFRPFQQSFLKKARHVIVSSPRLAESSESLQPHRAKVVVIPFGVDVSEWTERPEEADAIKERYPGPLLVFVGRLVYYKGLDVLMQAMRTVEATCLVLGDGPLRKSLEGKAAELAIRHKVVFLGEKDESMKKAFMHAADLFVLPSTSRAESFGISMMEAMACGTPAISTEVGTGTSWLNQNNATGIVVSPGDASALAGAIKALLAEPQRRAEMGHAASERVRQHFTRFAMLESLATLYRSI